MTPDERDLIDGLFTRLKQADSPDKDPEAQTLILDQVRRLPAAPYLMAQTILVQEHALTNAQTRIAQLEQQLAAGQRAPAAEPAPHPSFLGGLVNPASAVSAPRPAGPWGRRADPVAQPVSAYPATTAMAPAAGGGFLHNAIATAAGVAGGALLFQGVQSLLGHNAGPFAGASYPGGAIPENVTVNNYYGDQGAGHSPLADAKFHDDRPAPDSGLQDAAYTSDAVDTGGNFDDGDNGVTDV